jgi:subtilase family serine protease
VVNNGTAPANNTWVDRIILSADSIIGNADDVILASVNHPTGLVVGASYTQTATVRIPTRLDGNYRIAVITDANSSILEPDTRGDNTRLSSPITITQTYADLIPSITVAPSEVSAGRKGHVEWSVQNTGTVTTDTGRWVDQVYFSVTPTLDANARLMGSVTHVGNLAVGTSYNEALDFDVPQDLTGSYYIIVKTDAFASVYELGRTANNQISSSAATLILAEPKPNLVMSALTTSTQNWKVGETVQVDYTLSNIGNDVANSWMYERFSLVNVDDPSQVIELAGPSGNRNLAAGQTFSNQLSIVVPSIPSGSWRLQAQADYYGYVSESDETDNTASLAVQIVSPDLTVNHLTTTGLLQGGEIVNLTWMTQNIGTADAVNVREAVYLSNDDTVGADDIKLGEITHSILTAQGSTPSSLSFQLPITLEGSWRLIVVTDSDQQVNENGSEANNTDVLAINIARDYYADLQVDHVIAPTRVIADPASATVEWTVTNIGNGVGRTTSWTDTVIYSTDDVIGNDDDIILGTLAHDGGLAAGDSYTGTITYQFSPNFSREGHVYVRTDSAAQVWEHNQWTSCPSLMRICKWNPSLLPVKH